MPGEFKVACDFWTQQARYIGAVGIPPTLVEFSADSRAADVRIALQHGHFKPRFGEISPIGEAVMARTNDDRVVLVHCTLR